MIELIYVSKAYKRFEETELEDMLRVFRHSNDKSNITGLLLYDGFGTFVQVLEGDDHKVKSTFERIKQDTRHSRINVLGEHTITQPSFPEWRMGFQLLDASSAKNLAGYSDFLLQQNRTDYLSEQPSFVADLLHHFKSNL